MKPARIRPNLGPEPSQIAPARWKYGQLPRKNLSKLQLHNTDRVFIRPWYTELAYPTLYWYYDRVYKRTCYRSNTITNN